MKYYTFTNIFSKEYNRNLLEKCKPLLMDGETLDGFYGRGSTPAKQSHPTLHLNPNFDDFHNQILKRIKEESGLDLKLERSWVNGTHGKKKDMLWHSHEAFGTDYAGVYSFAIWLKIPTQWEDQCKLPFLDGMKKSDKKASIFEFEYHDILGGVCNYGYRLDPSMEGCMVFFPATLRHTVYPFYNCDESRISIAGNLWYRDRQ